MGTFGWIKAITRPQEYVQDLLKDRRNSVNFSPGVRGIVWFEIIWTAAFAIFAWGTLLVIIALASVLPLRWFWLRTFLEGFWAAHLGPVSMIVDAFWTVVKLGAGFWLLSWVVDQCYERLFGCETRHQIQVFNILVLSCLPLVLWVLVPILGWILGPVEAVLISFWALRAIYKEDAFKTGAAMIVSMFCVGVVNFAVGLGLMAIGSALPAMPHWDPTEGVISALVDRALPDQQGSQELKGLYALGAAAQAAAQPASIPSPEVAAIPTAAPTAATAPVPSPVTSPAHRTQAKAATKPAPARTSAPMSQANAAMDLAAAPATPAPTPVPTADASTGQALKDAAAGVDKAVAAKQLLHLFGH